MDYQERVEEEAPEAQVDGFKILADSTSNLAENVGGLKDEIGAFRNRSTRDRLFILLLSLLLVALTSLSYVEWRSDKQITALAKDGIACLVEQSFEHRFATREAHQSDASHHGYQFETAPVSKVTPEQVREAQALLVQKCAQFIRNR